MSTITHAREQLTNQRTPIADTWPSRAGADDPRVLRQTQGMIGVVILGSVAAAYFFGAAWTIIPAIIGTGLVVAGLSGICPMAMLIAKMPWNRSLVRAPESPTRSSCCGR